MHPRSSVPDFRFACSPTVGLPLHEGFFNPSNRLLNATRLITDAIATPDCQTERLELKRSLNEKRGSFNFHSSLIIECPLVQTRSLGYVFAGILFTDGVKRIALWQL